jgi:hypothetical protein
VTKRKDKIKKVRIKTLPEMKSDKQGIENIAEMSYRRLARLWSEYFLLLDREPLPQTVRDAAEPIFNRLNFELEYRDSEYAVSGEGAAVEMETEQSYGPSKYDLPSQLWSALCQLERFEGKKLNQKDVIGTLESYNELDPHAISALSGEQQEAVKKIVGVLENARDNK